MTATIVGFVTREEAGLEPADSVSRNVDFSKGGVAGHYGGPAQPGAGGPKSDDHADCVRTWKAWQKYHKSKGWVDIGYTGGYCNHGYAFAGRGDNVRPAAQGKGNFDHAAIVWIGGEGQTPTQLAVNAFEWWIATFRKAGAGMAVRVHNFFMKTKCAGKHISDIAKRYHNKKLGDPEVKPEGPRHLKLEKPYQQGHDVRSWQKDLNAWGARAGHGKLAVVDGYFGPNTNRASSLFVKEEMGVDKDEPIIGPKSLKAMKDALAGKSPQQKLNEVVAFLKRNVAKVHEVHKNLGLK